MRAIMRGTPSPTPTPIPTLADVLRPPEDATGVGEFDGELLEFAVGDVEGAAFVDGEELAAEEAEEGDVPAEDDDNDDDDDDDVVVDGLGVTPEGEDSLNDDEGDGLGLGLPPGLGVGDGVDSGVCSEGDGVASATFEDTTPPPPPPALSTAKAPE
jgi:hypothetical protein